jgi:hypothetical protein
MQEHQKFIEPTIEKGEKEENNLTIEKKPRTVDKLV